VLYEKYLQYTDLDREKRLKLKEMVYFTPFDEEL